MVSMIIALPVSAQATQWEISRLAIQLENASESLLRDSRAAGGYNSVSHNAQRLAVKAKQLTDSIARGRTSGYIRTRFTDVSRAYQRLESAILRQSRNQRNRSVVHEFDRVANIYGYLNNQFYGNTSYQSFRSSPPDFEYLYTRPLPPVVVKPHYRPDTDSSDDESQVTGRGNMNVESNNRRRQDYDHHSPVVDRRNRRELEQQQTGSRTETRQQSNLGNIRIRP